MGDYSPLFLPFFLLNMKEQCRCWCGSVLGVDILLFGPNGARARLMTLQILHLLLPLRLCTQFIVMIVVLDVDSCVPPDLSNSSIGAVNHPPPQVRLKEREPFTNH